jgi:hypothetical protein
MLAYLEVCLAKWSEDNGGAAHLKIRDTTPPKFGAVASTLYTPCLQCLLAGTKDLSDSCLHL